MGGTGFRARALLPNWKPNDVEVGRWKIAGFPPTQFCNMKAESQQSLNTPVRNLENYQMPKERAAPNWQLSRNHHGDVLRSSQHQRGGVDWSKDLSQEGIPELF